MNGLQTIEKMFDTFYTKFVLRDFLGKIIPGALFILIASFSIIKIEHIKIFYNLKEFWIWLLFIGVSWLVGFAIQGIGTFELKTKEGKTLEINWEKNRTPNLERKNYQFIRIFAKNYTYKTGEDRFLEFRKKCKDDKIIQQHERYVVIKEACGNGSLALLFSFFILLGNIIAYFIGNVNYENLFFLYLKDYTLEIAIFVFVLFISSLGLFRMNKIGAKYQMLIIENELK